MLPSISRQTFSPRPSDTADTTDQAGARRSGLVWTTGKRAHREGVIQRRFL